MERPHAPSINSRSRSRDSFRGSAGGGPAVCAPGALTELPRPSADPSVGGVMPRQGVFGPGRRAPLRATFALQITFFPGPGADRGVRDDVAQGLDLAVRPAGRFGRSLVVVAGRARAGDPDGH